MQRLAQPAPPDIQLQCTERAYSRASTWPMAQRSAGAQKRPIKRQSAEKDRLVGAPRSGISTRKTVSVRACCCEIGAGPLVALRWRAQHQGQVGGPSKIMSR